MADEISTDPTPATGDQAEEPTTEPTDPPAEQPGDGLHRALVAERERAKKAEKELKAAASKLKEFEDANKTEAQRQAEALTAAQEQARVATDELNRVRIAMRHGITEEDMDLLGTGSEEEIEARAQRVAAKNAAAQAVPATAPNNRRPVEQLRPGAVPVDELPADDSYPAHWRPAGV